MPRAKDIFLVALAIFPLCPYFASADGTPLDEDIYHAVPSKKKDKAFTGKVTRDRVRLRLSPSTDSPVVRELNKGDLLIVADEQDDFYAVKPPADTKGYLYRTYVLDGVVEGNKVNVRIDPHLEAPVVAQLNAGDRVEGKISEKNAKWLEIPLPESTQFYISADFVERLGDAGHLARLEKRKEEVSQLLNSTYLLSEQELQKYFTDMSPEVVVRNYQAVISDYQDFPSHVEQAKKYLAQFNEDLLRKKIDFLERKNKEYDLEIRNTPNQAFEQQTAASPRNNLHALEADMAQSRDAASANKIYKRWVDEKYASQVNARMALWIPVEIAYYEQWAEKNNNRPIQDFYQEQKGQSVALRGIIETYDRPVRNKPGDYLLVNKANKLPIAYLYSTHVNLQDKVGQEIVVEGILRPNNNFAYPAYFVISGE